MTVLALAPQTGVRLAEIGYLLILFAGVWLSAAQVPKLNLVPLERSSQASRSRSRVYFSSSPRTGVTSANG
jgi:hypothetical protein